MVSARKASMIWRLLLSAMALIMLALGLAGLITLIASTGFALRHEVNILGYALNPAHSILLLAVEAATLIAARWHGTLLSWCAVLFAGFIVLFLYGTTQCTAQTSSTWALARSRRKLPARGHRRNQLHHPGRSLPRFRGGNDVPPGCSARHRLPPTSRNRRHPLSGRKRSGHSALPARDTGYRSPLDNSARSPRERGRGARAVCCEAFTSSRR